MVPYIWLILNLSWDSEKKDRKLVLSDVVDNDSWRIWPGGHPDKQLDKQSFREGENLSNVSNKYQLVTELTNQFKGV